MSYIKSAAPVVAGADGVDENLELPRSTQTDFFSRAWTIFAFLSTVSSAL